MILWWEITHLLLQYVNKKLSISSLVHQLIFRSEWVPSEWESKQLIKKRHNDPEVIHMTPVNQLMSCETKSYLLVRNKSIIKAF